MTQVNAKTNGTATTIDILETTPETAGIWTSMQTQIKQWLTTMATLRMAVGADALWQLETVRALDTGASEKLRALKKAQNGVRGVLQENAEQALDDLKHTKEHVLLYSIACSSTTVRENWLIDQATNPADDRSILESCAVN